MSDLYAQAYRDRCQAEHVARVHGGTVIVYFGRDSDGECWYRIRRPEMKS